MSGGFQPGDRVRNTSNGKVGTYLGPRDSYSRLGRVLWDGDRYGVLTLAAALEPEPEKEPEMTLLDEDVTLYRVIYQIKGSSAVHNEFVTIRPGYSTFADIPKILAVWKFGSNEQEYVDQIDIKRAEKH